VILPRFVVRQYETMGLKPILNRVSRAIRLGNGRIIVLDLLKHNVEEARKLYAGHWLGVQGSALAGASGKKRLSRH
jgi:hypothetical protein